MKFIPVAMMAVLLPSVLFNVAAYGVRWWTHAPSCDDDEPLGLINAVAAFVTECLALTALMGMWPLAHLQRREQTTTPVANPAPIVLLHGWGLNVTSLWMLRRRLLQRGCGPVYLFAYRTRPIDVEGAAEGLRTLLTQVHRDCAGPITVIGHSLGGLVGRYCLRRYPVPGVRRLITLGTPHQGTIAARWGTRPLLPDSSLMRLLNTGDHVPDQFEVIAIASDFDALVIPRSHADYPGAFNIEIRGVGHDALLFSARVFALIAENLGGRDC